MNLAKARVEQKAVPEADVAVTKRILSLFATVICFYANSTHAAILPEERADVLYHSYDGGGVTIDGPSVLVRKNVGDKFSFSGNYYVDMVTSASVDVMTSGSPYTEERTEYSLGMDYLNDRTIMSLSYGNSTESDYIANTVGFTLSQEFFGDLSTITMGYSLGDDTVKATGSESFEASAKRRRFNIGFSQILTKRLITSFSYEAVFDEGFLRNPYREVRYSDAVEDIDRLSCDQDSASQGNECYPETRNSEALALRGIYAFNIKSSLRAEYRLYADSWDLESDNLELRYSYQLSDRWLFELRARQYQQSSGAFFYQDIIDSRTIKPEFYARDKELSEFTGQQYGLSVSYTFKSQYEFFNNSSVNFSWDYMQFNYDTFRDATQTTFVKGEEPLYSLDADIIRIFYSAYF